MFAIDSIDDGLRLTWDGQIVLDYHFQTGGPRTYWHPLRLPGSPALTMDRPGDHIHHQGMWVAWKSVNGVNFWEEPRPDADPGGFGRIAHVSIQEQFADSQKTGFSARNIWIDGKGYIHLSETRRTVVYAPQADHLVMDISLQFVSTNKSVTLDLKRGKPGGGGLFYSGLTVRFNNAMTPGQLLDADGRTEPMDVYGSSSRWCGLAGRHKADGQVYGITILDHPGNPRYPTAWWVRNAEDYALIQPCPCYHEPYEIPAGDTLELNYRVVLHRGYVDPELTEQLSQTL